ncbi:ATP-binding protein [Sphingopyxis sp.]|uniref:ATP-binding protein n=1 Tax=Sphingopyxis sp. TaxID=1908224 RepID=UPI0025DEAA6F|nr:ATP-binding protein [Sphingopyxis sp.]MBR2173456.1 hypothetical protein [Sphingopyxis sp.]
MSGVMQHEIDRALESDEVKLVLDRVKSPNERILLKRDLKWRRADIAIDVSDAREAADQARQRASVLRGQITADVNAGRHAERLIGSVIIVAILGIIWGIAAFFEWQWARGLVPVWSDIASTPWWTLLFWGAGAAALLVLAWEIFFVTAIAPRRERLLRTERDVAWHENVEKANNERLRGRIASVVASYLTEAINNRASPIFSARLQVYVENQSERIGRNAAIGVGLSEVVNEENIISTAPRARIVEMVARLPGGSIGISGPRGVGKSTLLNAICRMREGFGNRRIIAVSTAAPVEYQARDFLLHLFSSLCRRVLEEEGVDRGLAERELAEFELAEWQRSSWAARGKAIRKLLLLVMFASLATAGVIGFANDYVARAAVTTAATEAAALKAALGAERWQEMQRLAKTVNTNAPGPASRAPAARAAAKPAAPVAAAAYVFGVTPGPFLVLALMAAALLAALFAYDPRAFFGRPDLLRRGRRSVPRMVALDGAGNYGIAERSAHELRNIHFQRSYTTGWSGAIKFPAGIDIGVSGTLALQQKAESLPELVERFRAYVGAVAGTYGTVVFGIDELDKLRSASEGEAFLNGVKSVFNIENCFYLISVSEDALSAFDRRGIGIRDVFDSALDEVLHVDFLDVVEARRLLSRRILRLPDPFLQLCYMLSGGLPRDLIRHARQLLELAATKKDQRISLRDAVKTLVAADLGAKLRATQVAIRALKELPQTNALLARISELPHEGPLGLLERRLSAFQAELDALERDSDEGRRLARLADELAAYMETMMLVRRTGAIMDGKDGWELANDKGLGDLVAGARQALEVSVPLAQARIEAVRKIVVETAQTVQGRMQDRTDARGRKEQSRKSETHAG